MTRTPPPDSPLTRRPTPRHEVKIWGARACEALFLRRSENIIRVYVQKEIAREWSALLKWCASQRLAYHLVSHDDLMKITDSQHHEGVCLLVKNPAPLTFDVGLAILLRSPRQQGLVLENVENPHNMGSILRVCAHYGVPVVFCKGSTPQGLSGSLARTSEGGCEHVQLAQWPDSNAEATQTLKNHNIKLLGTSGRAQQSVYEFPWAPLQIIAFGSEKTGLTPGFLRMCDSVLTVPGTGWVQSLNISTAVSAVLGQICRPL